MLFASGAEHVHFSYRRYLENRLREAFGFGGTPIRIVVRERSRVELEPRRRRTATGHGAKPSTRRAAKARGKAKR